MNKASPTFAALSSVIADGDFVTLRNYLENGNSNPNECDEYGQTLLMIAAQHGQPAIVNELIAQGADVNAEDSDNWSALMNAAKAGHNDIVIKLLDHGAFVEKRDMGSWTPLMWACYRGHYDIVQTLLDHNATVNVHDKFHCSCLTWAAGRGFYDIVRILLENGAKVNSGDKFGSSSLLWACRKGFTDIVQVLLDAGANVDTAGMFSWTPLIVAAKGNYTAIVNMLLEHKPNVNAVDMDGCTALTVACKEGHTEIAVALMNAAAYINLQDRNGDTNLIHAAKAGHFSIVDALLKKYADVDLHGSERKTVLYWAVEKGYADIVRLLLTANPNLESATKDGDASLLKATRIRNAEIVQLLIDKKCKVSVTDKKGDTALHIAMRARSKAIIEILLRNPKNSQLLYRPNRAGETPYNIDTNHQKSILAQIFGARRLNTNEDSENRLGYDLYSSALADILSEPSLSMPISVGLYAKWGSGKSFLLNKLENEMRSFAIQWLEPSFEFSWLVFLLVALVSLTMGVITFIASHEWIAGTLIASCIFVLSFVFLGTVVYGNKKYYWSKFSRISIVLAAQLNALRTLLFIIFCNPPAKRRNTVSDPVRFLFTEQTKVTSSGNDNSIVQIVISLHMAIEKEYGFLTSRLYRVFRPKPVQAQRWQWRRLCCIPNFLIALFVFGCILGAMTLLLIDSDAKPEETSEKMTVVHSILIALGCVVCLILVSNLYTWMQLVKALIISHQRRIARNLAMLESSQTMNYITSLKSEVDMIVQMVQCLDAFVGQQTRLVVIVDGLDSCEQEKVLHVLDAVHLLFSDISTPFLTVLAIDPHIIIKAIESNINRVFHNTSISGHEYLRNVVHLPFYLQNSGLRRVKAAQQAATCWAKKSNLYWNEDRECDRAATTAAVSTSRKASNSSISIPDTFRKRPAKGSQKLKASDSMASSISNLHRVVLGAQDLTKVLLTDDYFSDVNPRSMRRLMNIVYVTGRLLKAFNIDFNWYHLASWVNITEQWPYRTSWIIMYYEMHETELDEMMSLKGVYEKIKDYIPSCREDDPALDLDHDERKFEVFLSFHSSNLLINDLKVFLPFTINLDPYIRKTIQEENQAASEILKTDLRPSHQSNAKSEAAKWVQTQPQIVPRKSILSPTNQYWGPSLIHMNNKNGLQYQVAMGAPLIASPPTHFPPVAAQTPWWGPTADSCLTYGTNAPSPKLCPLNLPSGEKLSLLSVDDIISLLSTLEKIDQKKLQNYDYTLKENNINGQVLLTCDLKELKDVLSMSFGDWELFRVVILSLREQELADVDSVDATGDHHNQNLIHIPKAHQMVMSHRSSPSGCDSPDAKKKDTSQGNGNKPRTENIDSRGYTRGRSASSVLEKQVTMEESMIVGALETLNEEALEDAMEEKLSIHRDSNTASSGIPSNPLSPILSDPEEQASDELLDPNKIEQHPVTYTLNSPSEVDIMYLKNMRDSPMLHVSAISLSDSITDLETSSVGHTQHFQPIVDLCASPVPLLRTASNSSGTASSTSSPSKSQASEKPKPKNLPQRPSSLVYDSTCSLAGKRPSFEGENLTSKLKSSVHTNKPVSKSQDKFKQISQSMKRKTSKKKKHQDKKGNSSTESSTETEELLPQPKKPVVIPQKVSSPQSEVDGFYSDDEHTPLVSPFHSNQSSQYNLQSAQKHDKESTSEKVIPKQSQSDVGVLKLRKPLERQFSIDSYLCDRNWPSVGVADIQGSMSSSTHSGHHLLCSHGLPVYGQHVADTPSPENQTIEHSDSNPNIHTETVL